MCFIYTIYTEKVRKKRREDNNDYDADADKRTAAHRSSSSYDIDNSSSERPKLYFPCTSCTSVYPSPLVLPSARDRILSREGERTAIFIEARIHRGVDLVKLRRS